jgi:hypothetical protein
MVRAGVGLQAVRFDGGFEVDDDAFVAEADAEVLQAPVPAARVWPRRS